MPGPSTYLHAGCGKGWPHDHKAEDTFELPRRVPAHEARAEFFSTAAETPQYSAGFTGSGKVILVLSTPERTIAYFDTFADAQTAAQALNELKGY